MLWILVQSGIVNDLIPFVSHCKLYFCKLVLNELHILLNFCATKAFHIFSLTVQIYRKSYCTTPCVAVGSGGISKMFKVFLYDGQGSVNQFSCTKTGLFHWV